MYVYSVTLKLISSLNTTVPEFIDPRFRENKPKTLLFSHRKRAFSACFRENCVYNFGHRPIVSLHRLEIIFNQICEVEENPFTSSLLCRTAGRGPVEYGPTTPAKIAREECLYTLRLAPLPFSVGGVIVYPILYVEYRVRSPKFIWAPVSGTAVLIG